MPESNVQKNTDAMKTDVALAQRPSHSETIQGPISECLTTPRTLLYKHDGNCYTSGRKIFASFNEQPSRLAWTSAFCIPVLKVRYLISPAEG